MASTAVLYRLILLGHIAAAIVGFGGLVTQGAFHARAVRSSPSEAHPVLAATDGTARMSEYGLYATLAFGIVLVSLSADIGYGRIWIWASLLVWTLIVGLTHGLVRPARRHLITVAADLADVPAGSALAADPTAADLTADPTADDLDPAGDRPAPLADRNGVGPLLARLAAGEAATQLLLAVALALMIWKPGG